jgi:hypothetical protein
MIAVVNHMRLSRPIDEDVYRRVQTELIPAARQIEGFHDALCVKIGDEQMVMIVLCETPEALQRVHGEVGDKWIGEIVRPYVGTVDRKVGDVVARAVQ